MLFICSFEVVSVNLSKKNNVRGFVEARKRIDRVYA